MAAGQRQRRNFFWQGHRFGAICPAVGVEALLPPQPCRQVDHDVDAIALVLPPDVTTPPEQTIEFLFLKWLYVSCSSLRVWVVWLTTRMDH